MTTYYVDKATGSNSNTGTSKDDAFEDLRPVESNDGFVELQPGDTVKISDSAPLTRSETVVLIDIHGEADDPIVIEPYDDASERPAVEYTGLSNDGWNLAGSQHLTIRGLEVYTTDRSGRWGIKLSSSPDFEAHHIRLEDLVIHDVDGNQICGLDGSRDCEIVGCETYGGRDSGNADGVAITNGAEAYLVERTVAHHNADDGFDLRKSSGERPSLLRDCVAYENGVAGDGLGFKTGIASGDGGGTGGTMFERCIAHDNPRFGFRVSGDPGYLYNCTAYNNGEEGFFVTDDGYELKNNAAFGNAGVDVAPATESNNTWNLDITNPEYASTDPGDDGFLRPTDDSPLVDQGTTSVDLDYSGDAPDLGAKEHRTASSPALRVQDGSGFVSPSAVRYYDGNQWVAGTMKTYLDGKFVTVFE